MERCRASPAPTGSLQVAVDRMCSSKGPPRVGLRGQGRRSRRATQAPAPTRTARVQEEASPWRPSAAVALPARQAVVREGILLLVNEKTIS
eukprot:scaffold301117_cov30-Tisochrysis_lutea.AAC.5